MPRIRPSFKLDLSSTKQEPKEHSKKNTQDWMRSNMTTILEKKKMLSEVSVSHYPQPPFYERAKDAGFGFDMKDWRLSNTYEDVFIHVSRNEGKLKGEYDGDKIHISVSFEKLEDAYNSIAPILYSDDCPFDKWKVTDNSKCPVRSRVSDGAQFTLYAKPDKDDSTYSAEYLKSVESMLNKIETTLIKDNISTGSKPESDVSKESWKYLSYRNENRSDRVGGSDQEVRLKNEPFFQCI